MGFDGSIEEFTSAGNINLDIFSWWWDPQYTFDGPYGKSTIGELAAIEIAIYDHHYRREERNDKLGWLRTMVYSITQQLMRMDITYWMAYSCLRPDRNYWLISYPYYMKNARLGDSTFFRHVDIDINRAVKTGRGTNMIQGSLSLTDETEDMATEILPRMHLHMGEWEQRATSRGASFSEVISAIKEVHFTTHGDDPDTEHFGTDWTKVPCRRGEVRISYPHLPHGAQKTAVDAPIRNTMLPWFVGIGPDHATLEVLEGGSWDDLSKAHRDFEAPPKTPSGLPNKYGKIPYAFPPAPQVIGLGPISDALVGRLKWTNPAVASKVRIMLGTNKELIQEKLTHQRKLILARTADAFHSLVDAEKECFGNTSFFYTRKQSLPRPVKHEDLLPDTAEFPGN